MCLCLCVCVCVCVCVCLFLSIIKIFLRNKKTKKKRNSDRRKPHRIKKGGGGGLFSSIVATRAIYRFGGLCDDDSVFRRPGVKCEDERGLVLLAKGRICDDDGAIVRWWWWWWWGGSSRTTKKEKNQIKQKEEEEGGGKVKVKVVDPSPHSSKSSMSSRCCRRVTQTRIPQKTTHLHWLSIKRISCNKIQRVPVKKK